MRDQITAAEYANAEHTELVYTTIQDGVHRITKNENPSFWVHVHQRVPLKNYDPGSQMIALAPPSRPSRVIDITPQKTALAVPQSQPAMSQPAIAPPQRTTVEVGALRIRIAELERENARLAMAVNIANDYVETEAAAEYAVLVNAPDGAVDPTRKAVASAYLQKEAQMRGVVIDDLLRMISAERDERNKRIMDQRLQRIGG